MNKKQFREIVTDNYNRFGKPIIIGDVIFNQCVVYNPRINREIGYSYLSLERTVNCLWRIARRIGQVQYNGMVFEVI